MTPAPIGGDPGFGAGPAAGSGPGGGAGAEDYENEPPLLEELGINAEHILQKTLAVLNPFRATRPEVAGDSDLAGPLVFCLVSLTFSTSAEMTFQNFWDCVLFWYFYRKHTLNVRKLFELSLGVGNYLHSSSNLNEFHPILEVICYMR